MEAEKLMPEYPEYKEIYPVVLEDLEDVEDGKLCPKYQFGEDEPEFAYEEALAVLLMDRVIFPNNFHWRKDWSDEAKEATTLFVNCNDVFMWGASDADNLPFKELENLYEHYHKDKAWGPAVWCIKQRGYLPQKPVYEAIQKQGIWALDTMGLKPSIDDQIKKNTEEMHQEQEDPEKSWWMFWKR